MLTANQVIDKYFLETRCMLVEIAATLDRIDRAVEASGESPARDDRVVRIRRALSCLANEQTGSNRSEQLLLMFSDQV
jgi:hypothetical protein